jgi:hypothetical protein
LRNVPEGDAVLVEGDEPAVGDGDAVGVARQISEHRLGSAYKDYRADGRARYKTMTLATDEFIRGWSASAVASGISGCFGRDVRPITRARDLLRISSATTERRGAEPMPGTSASTS